MLTFYTDTIMNYSQLSIPKRLVLTKEAIQIVQNDAVLREALAEKGYTPAELSIGLALQAEAVRLFQGRKVGYGTGIQASSMVFDYLGVLRGNFGTTETLHGSH